MRTRILTGLAGSVVSLAVTVGCLEIGLRLRLSRPDDFRTTALETVARSPLSQPDFRLRRYELRPRPGVFRILAVGDSFAWGGSVHADDAFPDRMARRLRAASESQDIEVLNWSRPGWCTWRQYESLRDRVDELEPDLVVWSFVLNDPEPVGRREARRLMIRSGIIRRRPAAGPSAYLYRRSRLYELVWTRLENTRQRRAMVAYYHSLFEGETWRRARAALRRIQIELRDRGVPLVLVIFPVFDSRFDDTYPYTDLHAKIAVAAGRLELPVLDLLAIYRGVDTRRLAVVPFTDPHPNELAHRLAADAILEYLADRQLIPTPGRSSIRRAESAPDQ